MKQRPSGFLADDKLPHDSEIFDYIGELHEYLWKFVRAVIPGASGKIEDFVDIALEKTEGKVVAIMDGGEWSNASVEHLIIPKDTDLENAYVRWEIWKTYLRLPQTWLSFADWLKLHHGARPPTKDELVEFWEVPY